MAKNDELKKLPAVDKILLWPAMESYREKYPHQMVLGQVRLALADLRRAILNDRATAEPETVMAAIENRFEQLTTKSLRPVINATGVIIHTNLGRAPLGESLLGEVKELLTGYSNLEYNLETAGRGSRYTHVSKLLKYLTGAEDILVVNNNAAAIMLVLRTLAKNREVIISRGELIEIGGSFRMPDIMAASDCKMVEVGTTNKTRIADFEHAVTSQTALLLKAHQSNYVIKGFTLEASLEEMVALGAKKEIPVVYDMGSGLLRKADIDFLADEPDVKSTLQKGIDLVTFSGDKLLGGPQAGIIAGKKHFIEKLKKEPMTRALRVGKTTLAMLEAICLNYLNEKKLMASSPVFRMMTSTPENLESRAESLSNLLTEKNIPNLVIDSEGQTGGGSLPEKRMRSYAVQIDFGTRPRNEKNLLAETLFGKLLQLEKPLLGVLRQGNLVFDVLTITEQQIGDAAAKIERVYREAGL